MPAYHVLYRQSMGRILTLVNNSNAELPVQACPNWTVRDTVAHLLGTLSDLIAGKIDESANDDWAAKQIERTTGRSLSDLASEWHVRANTTPGIFERYGALLVAEIVTHEFDIKQAIGNTQGRNEQVVRTVALFYLALLDSAWREDGVPPLRILTESSTLDIGGEDPQASVEMSWWEIGRVVTGRRSIAQVEALAWNGSAAPWLDHLFIFGPRETDLIE